MPVIEGYTEGETVKRGQQLELTCRSRGGNPPAQIVWYRNNEQVRTVYRTEGSFSESVLSLIAKAQDNNARYRCEVSNIMSVEPMKVHADLTVLCKYSEDRNFGLSECFFYIERIVIVYENNRKKTW